MSGCSTRRSTSCSNSRFVSCCSSNRLWVIWCCMIGISMRVSNITLCIEPICRIFEDCLPMVTNLCHSFLSPTKLYRCVQSDMITKGTCISPTLGSDKMLIRPLFHSTVSAYLWHPPTVQNLNFGIEAFQGRIAAGTTSTGHNEMFHLGWLPD